MDLYQYDENEVNGICLDNYVPYQRNHETVLYVHKRVLEEEQAEYEANIKKSKLGKKKKEKKDTRVSTGSNTEIARNNTVLEQTVQFAKHIAPIVIPSYDDKTPVYYSVETCSRCRKRDVEQECIEYKRGAGKELKAQHVSSSDTYKKAKCKKIIETFRKEEKRKRLKNTSLSESVSHCSQSTLDDININQSLSCSISEQSDKRAKVVKNEVNSQRQKRKNKCAISESFQAVTEDLTKADDTKIKIQLMTSEEKQAFCDSIKTPVLHAIKECILELGDNGIKEEVRIVKRIVKSNMNKIDEILKKLTSIEHQLSKRAEPQVDRKSMLEELSADIEIEEKSSEDEFEGIHRPKEIEDIVDNKGCGEVVNMKASTSIGVKTDKSNRLPARFCWTDAKKP